MSKHLHILYLQINKKYSLIYSRFSFMTAIIYSICHKMNDTEDYGSMPLPFSMNIPSTHCQLYTRSHQSPSHASKGCYIIIIIMSTTQ